jgi:hypothetical protein
MIDCSSDRWVGISIDEASVLHSVACILHLSAVITAIPRFEVGAQHSHSPTDGDSAWLHADSLINNAHSSK